MISLRTMSIPALRQRYAYLRRLSRRLNVGEAQEAHRWRVEYMVDAVTHELGRRDLPLSPYTEAAAAAYTRIER